jgi:Tol biopolymer transport system component/predicted Ser/Thr protein kinase
MESGTRLGHYEIVEPLGAGGMGEVYLARDTRLSRDVAVKVLPPEMAADAERLARFEQEARALAALNHPNIAQVYGLEPGDQTVIVMEMVEGQDLGELLVGGALPVQEVLPIARQIAEALEAAHEAGIVHRDLKPANVRVRPDGTVKVLDFGLAKSTEEPAASGNAAESPTIMSPALTGVGVIMGTAAYMSPEQARGRPVDRRADVWAFGCVLYEMLSGQSAFRGDDVSMIMASVLKKDLQWDALPQDTPSPLRRMIERCLETEPRRRYQSIGDARLELEDWIADGFDLEAGQVAPGAAPPATSRRFGILLPAFLVVAAAVLSWVGKPTPETPLRVLRLDTLIPDMRFGIGDDVARVLVLPDGSAVLVRDAGRVWLQPLDGSDRRLLVEGAQSAVLSPDGTRVIVEADNSLDVITIATGSTTPLADAVNYATYGVHWGVSDRVLMTKGGEFGLQALDVASGEYSQLLALGENDTRFLSPSELPNGDVIFSLLSRGIIEVFDGTDRHRVHSVTGADVEEVTYATSGQLLWSQWGANEGIWAAPYSLDERALTGAPTLLSPAAGSVSVSDNGLLVIVPRPARAMGSREVVLMERDGTIARTLLEPQQGVFLTSARLSRDGRRIAYQTNSRTSGNSRVFVRDLELGISVELGARAPGNNHTDPRWMPDGSAVLYLAGPLHSRTLVLEEATGSAEPQILVPEGVMNFRFSVSADGRYVAYATLDEQLAYLDLENGESVPFSQSEDNHWSPALSPDGRYMAYFRMAPSGTPGLFVEPFPDGGMPQLVAGANGATVAWSADGLELYLDTPGSDVFAVRLDRETGRAVSRPEPLFASPSGLDGFDVTADGRFVVPRSSGVAPATGVQAPILIENWPKLIDR